ncbi:MAG: type II toxin-antitoxin system VapB family antitoxin [Nitrososphaerales archaeon]
MSKTSVITVKIPKELKERMKEVDVNWSEYIRSTIIKKVEEHELRNASEKLDKIRAKAKPVPTSELISWIKEDRSR